MRILIYRLYGDPNEIAKVIGEVSHGLKAPLFIFPGPDGLSFNDKMKIDYPGDMPILKSAAQVYAALTPKGAGWSVTYPKIGIIRPQVWKQDEEPTDDQGEIVGFFDFAPRHFRDEPSTLRVVEMESLSTFFDAFVANLRHILEKRRFLRDIEDFSIRHVGKRYTNIEEDNLALTKQIEAPKKGD